MLTHLLQGLATSQAKCAFLHGPHADCTFAFPPTRRITSGPSTATAPLGLAVESYDSDVVGDFAFDSKGERDGPAEWDEGLRMDRPGLTSSNGVELAIVYQGIGMDSGVLWVI
jgi:hypothetical protein